MTRGILDWMFRNRATGEVTVFQRPNLVLTIFLVATALDVALPRCGVTSPAPHLIATAALLWWAVDELTSGVNPFRRFLGAGVLIYEAARVLLG